ncbi:multidrug resistance protein fnx1 [Metarhizium acridum CQMa 102]|uniref:Multidrug resistance protein fnx1 n=1 Tax=Metarhizium acridum (strain CQMa 102) TaxID=655827 RepID=E9E732_METAQ|nr:multidrug resistance protein fnx1 [Metarhizium acridum CQMa 102]EFY88207.1 multidrug resistance protein fnx1 [Metarhizium acridum CQMa 102]
MFVLLNLGVGLFSRFGPDTSKAEYIIIQIIFSFGLGLLTTSNLPAVQADLPESDAAVSTAAFDFLRSYGAIWGHGVSVPAPIFNARCALEACRVGDQTVRAVLDSGAAYGYVTNVLSRLPPAEPSGPRRGLILVFCEKEIMLRTTLETEYGFDDKKGNNADKAVENGASGASSDGETASIKPANK